METISKKPKTVNEYISRFPKSTQTILEKLRTAIQKAAPEAEEVIGYQMAAFKLHGNLVYFAAHKNHIGLYPTSSGIKAFQKEFIDYKWSKGAVQFPLDKPLPLDLIIRIVKFRMQEELQKAERKTKPKQDFLSMLSSPARRALENKNIKTAQQLARFTEEEILDLHGMGKASLPSLRNALKLAGLAFKRK